MAGLAKLGSRSGSDYPATRNQATRGLAVLDLIFRAVAFVTTLGSAIAMVATKESLPFFNRFIRFRAKYNDFTTFVFFAAANGIVSAYLALSVPLSIVHIIRSSAKNSRIILVFFDTAMLALLNSAASAATAIVYLAHYGNTPTNWFSICQQFGGFCRRASGTLIGSFAGVVLMVLLILLSGMALSRR